MRKLNEFWVWTFVFIPFLSTMIRSQPLFDDDDVMFYEFHNSMKVEGLRSLLGDTETLLKEKEIELKEERKEKDSIVGSYVDLLHMYASGTVPRDETVDEICAKNSRFITKTSNECHTYYNCSGEEFRGLVHPYNFWPSVYKHECHYPFAFSVKTLQCENYTKVDCGTRKLPTWECRYFRNACHLSHCIPCEIRFPKCENRADGFWPQPERGITPFYMICKDQRTISTGYCPTDSEWNVQSYPYKGKCVHRYAIPKADHRNGLLPSCYGKIDGNYQYPDRPCDAYYKCENGVASAVKCPNNTVFDSTQRNCEPGGNCNN